LAVAGLAFGLLSGAAPAAEASRQTVASEPQPSRNTAVKRAQPQRQTASRARVARAAPGERLRDAPQELIPVAADASLSLAPPRAACLAAARRAEEVHGLPEGLLTAIALAESGLHAYALNVGGRAHFPQTRDEARAILARATSRSSVMAGCMQVNARVHARGSDWPLDPAIAADWAGGMLARWAREQGDWAEALRRWHGGSPASTRRLVCKVRAKMEVTNPASDLFEDWSCAGGDQRLRATGSTHLRMALLESD
jgi:hypothetical protein